MSEETAQPTIRKPRRRRALAVIGLTVVALGAAAGTRVVLGYPPVPAFWRQSLPTASPAIGGPFTLIDQNGRAVTEKDFHGRHMLAFFGYTYCPDVCPTTLTHMTQALEALGPKAERVTPVFVSVDPARDTPEQLKEYARFFHPRLVALTGTAEQVAAAAKAFRVYYAKVAGGGADDYLMDHTGLVYLMGPDGAFVTHFSHTTDAEAIARRLKDLL
jgi:protein SCO1/2